MIDKKRLAAEAASEGMRGFLQGLGFFLALWVVAVISVIATIAIHHPIPIAVGTVVAAILTFRDRRRQRALRQRTVTTT